MKPKQLLTNFQTEEKVQEKPVKQPKPIETAEKPEMVKKDTVKPTDLVKKDTETPADLVKKPDVKQGSPHEAIGELGEERKPEKETGQKQPPRGFVQAKDGTFVPREYSDEEVNDAYFGASRFFRKGGSPEDFLTEHPDAYADAVYSAYHDYKTGNEWEERRKEREETEPQSPKYQGGVALDMQNRGFKPYEVDEETQTLKVKDENGSEYIIKGDGRNAFDVYKDGNKVFSHIPNYYDLSTIVAGKPEAGLEKYEVKQASRQSSDVKEKVEGLLGRKFSEEEWAEILRLAKSVR